MGDLTPLSDIMDQLLRDLKSGKTAEDFRLEETSYRRGYHQGYDQAIIDIFSLLNTQKMDTVQVYDLIALHADLLGIWRIEGRDQFIPPPRFNQALLLETLEHRRNLQRGDE